MNGPKIHREILESSKEICRRQKKEAKKKALKNWLAANIIAILALIVSAVSVLISALRE